MSTRRASQTLAVVLSRGLVALMACLAGFVPFAHVVSASATPIVVEDGEVKSSTTGSQQASRRRRRTHARLRRRTFDVRAARISVRSVTRRAPVPTAPLLAILRL